MMNARQIISRASQQTAGVGPLAKLSTTCSQSPRHAPLRAPLPGPVITFFSPSPSASRSAVTFLHELLGLPEISGKDGRRHADEERPSLQRRGRSDDFRDELDALHFGKKNASMRWHSVACACPSSGAVLHFLSLSDNSGEEIQGKSTAGSSPLRLLAVHGCSSFGPLSKTPSGDSSRNSSRNSPENSCENSSGSSSDYWNSVLQSRQRLADIIQNQQFFVPPQTDNNENTNAQPYATSGNYWRGLNVSSIEAKLRGFLFQLLLYVGKSPSPSWIISNSSKDHSPLFIDNVPFRHAPSPAAQSPSKHDYSLTDKSNIASGVIPLTKHKLREIALPFFPEHSSLQSQLSSMSLHRPLPGLYQCCQPKKEDYPESNTKERISNDGIILRPLPAASEDLRLPPPSLIFQCPNLMQAKELVEERLGGRTSKIGWRGGGNDSSHGIKTNGITNSCGGSLIINHSSVFGLDLRICESSQNDWHPSGFFDEAQESLLAGSLADLQSAHVVSEGMAPDSPASGSVNTKAKTKATTSLKTSATHTKSRSNTDKNEVLDEKVGVGDCWIEFRSNVKHPLGFWRQLSSLFPMGRRNIGKWFAGRGNSGNSGGNEGRVAKPPDLPFE